MSVEDVKATLHNIADTTGLQVTILREATTNIGILLIELGELIIGSNQSSLANAAYVNIEITLRIVAHAIERADRSTDLARAYANTL